jgi:hypothetical protein
MITNDQELEATLAGFRFRGTLHEFDLSSASSFPSSSLGTHFREARNSSVGF